MKKVFSQVSVAIICGLLGFLLTSQFKTLMKDSNLEKKSNLDIVKEIGNLKKQKEELEKTNAGLSEQLKKLEDSILYDKGAKEIKKQLDNSRMILGLESVKGQGVEIKISPKISIFGGDGVRGVISENELIHITNLLWFSGAEAISINGSRLTMRSGIKNSNNYIWIGKSKQISPEEDIIIKAIGGKQELMVGLNFPGGIDYGALENYDYTITEKDEVIIEKTTENLEVEYLKKGE